MGIIGFIGFAKVLNLKAAYGMLGTEIWNVFSSYGLTVIPLFILMGQICFYSGVNERLYKSAYAWDGPYSWRYRYGNGHGLCRLRGYLWFQHRHCRYHVYCGFAGNEEI